VILLRGCAVSTIQFTSDIGNATAGVHREEDGRLSGQQWLNPATGAVRDCPQYADERQKLPTMSEIFSTKFMRELRGTEIDLTGYVDEDQLIRLIPVEV
jgi:hypothetical protein